MKYLILGESSIPKLIKTAAFEPTQVDWLLSI